ncbi:uncharacterized protein LOC130047575 [Ostrea edulis]|uniref:uncharacterized protein LOC130047575 n=1 Tax=Ostrea edulis TaxID=37623 RepID=UPI0024AF2433|nr:uncharacterized protein LOC130047575 [Ostrea edulis]
MVESALKQKLANIPKLTDKDNKRLYELCDVLSEVEALKEDKKYALLLAYFDSSAGILPVLNKLPHSIQEKWTNHAVNYIKRNDVSFPPFSVFVEFMRDISRVKNDPSFQYGGIQSSTEKPFVSKTKNFHVTAKKTISQQEVHEEPDKECPLHRTKQPLNDCRVFRNKSLEERRKFVKENGICFKCCESTKHAKRNCRKDIKCTECNSDTHPSALHGTLQQVRSLGVPRADGGEGEKRGDIVDTKCTQICKNVSSVSRSCSKTVLVNVYCEGFPNNAVKLYAIIDDQSNRSLAKSKLFDDLQVKSRLVDYILTSCAGSVPTKGRRATGLVVQSLDGSTNLKLPTLIECNNIPNVRSEIPTPDVARSYPHLQDIAKYIPNLDDGSDTLLLIGRDLMEAHHVLDQRLGPRTTPYAQRLRLGWVIVGESCLNGTHRPEVVNVNKVHILGNGRPSLFEPCVNVLNLKESGLDTCAHSASFNTTKYSNCNNSDIFVKTATDEKIAFSIEDSEFLELMDSEFRKDCDGSWTAPLPFRKNRPKLPNNRSQAMKRARILTDSLRKNTQKRQHFTEFMEKIFMEGHAEPLPLINSDKECWYLPLFGVYHPQKPDQIRGVFDSSAKFNNISLNDVLMSGPDLTNRLIGILLGFRQEPVALMADIQRMFYCFKVEGEHRNYLRFLWHKDNNIDNEIVDFRMCVHVFGNSPSPAVATYGLRRTAMLAEKQYGADMREFVNKKFMLMMP